MDTRDPGLFPQQSLRRIARPLDQRRILLQIRKA
jgi:hypothetical protein